MAIAASSAAARTNEKLLFAALERVRQRTQGDPEMAQSAPLPRVIETLQNERLAAIEVFARACEAYAERPALGQRDYALETGPGGQTVRYLPGFRTITYREAWRRTADLATGLVRDPRTALKPGEVVGIYGFGSVDYVIADMACLYAGRPSAVLQVGMAAEDLRHIVNEAAFASIICALDNLPDLLALLPGCPTVRSVVVMDLRPEVAMDIARLGQSRARTALPLPTMAELARAGRGGPLLDPWLPAAGTDPLATLMYTSGSTGFPKGAMLTQNVWRWHWRLSSLPQLAEFPNIGINFYPLSHAMGRNAVVRTLMVGGVMHFTLNSDLSTLFEDIRLARPTILHLVPRISEMIYQAYRTGMLRHLKDGVALPEAQEQARAAMRGTFLGDRLVAAVIGSAPTAPEIAAFLGSCFEIPVYEGYGSTEGGIISIDGELNRPLVTDSKLIDVPELGYRSSDQPFPRGELLVKTRQSIPGYFNNADATRALFDEDGFLRTGDIVEQRAPDQFIWVDRKNNVVKLAQGEYVTLWRLESIFSGGSPCLEQVYLHANSQRAYLLAVVVPDRTAVGERLRLEGQEPAPAAVRQLLRSELNRIAGEAGLRSYEVPRDFLVEGERWTRENGLLTGVGKPARPQLKRKYGERLEALYCRIEEQREQDLASLGRDGAALPLATQLQKAVAAVLGVPDLELGGRSFKDLGGDSISALSLALLLEKVCGVPVPVAAILNPASPVLDLVRFIEAHLGPGAAVLPRFDAIHGDPAWIRAGDLRLDRLLSPEDLSGASAVAALPLAPVRTVLLTGANGFLGHVLLLEWLEQAAVAGGKVYAIVRGPDDRAAAARLGTAYRGGEPALELRFARLAARNLVVLAGDLAAPRLGLTDAVYQQLAAEVDLIVHPGALVNHVFSYEQLFAPNVLGTAQLIGLALQKRPKRVDFVSTIGVLAGARGSGRVPEEAGVEALQDAWPAQGGYAHGYAASKWACEVLLRELRDRFGLPVRVFRPSMILPHRSCLGQANVPDMLSRLLASVIYTGLAPRSFYREGVKGHYDGLPVDFIAAAMVALSSARPEGCATFQVSNANWEDGVSLDTLMDWVQSAGYPIERVSDHGAWYEAFRAKLEALPAAERQYSAVAILEPWARPWDGRESERVDATRFCEEVRRRRPGGESGIPHLDEAFLHKYLADLRALGVLDPRSFTP